MKEPWCPLKGLGGNRRSRREQRSLELRASPLTLLAPVKGTRFSEGAVRLGLEQEVAEATEKSGTEGLSVTSVASCETGLSFDVVAGLLHVPVLLVMERWP